MVVSWVEIEQLRARAREEIARRVSAELYLRETIKRCLNTGGADIVLAAIESDRAAFREQRNWAGMIGCSLASIDWVDR